jgi:Tfp pilus assembly protein PilX
MLSRHSSLAHRKDGFALVLVLGFVVLLLVMTLAFFSNSILQSSIADSSANQTKADVFARGAMDTIIGDLKQEIADGSAYQGTPGGRTVYTGPSGEEKKVYYPTSNSTAVPDRSGSDDQWLSVVKRSAANTAFYQGTDYAAPGPTGPRTHPRAPNRSMAARFRPPAGTSPFSSRRAPRRT